MVVRNREPTGQLNCISSWMTLIWKSPLNFCEACLLPLFSAELLPSAIALDHLESCFFCKRTFPLPENTVHQERGQLHIPAGGVTPSNRTQAMIACSRSWIVSLATHGFLSTTGCGHSSLSTTSSCPSASPYNKRNQTIWDRKDSPVDRGKKRLAESVN